MQHHNCIKWSIEVTRANVMKQWHTISVWNNTYTLCRNLNTKTRASLPYIFQNKVSWRKMFVKGRFSPDGEARWKIKGSNRATMNIHIRFQGNQGCSCWNILLWWPMGQTPKMLVYSFKYNVDTNVSGCYPSCFTVQSHSSYRAPCRSRLQLMMSWCRGDLH